MAEKRWYVLQVLSGGEEKAVKNIEMLKEKYEKNEETKGIIGSIRIPMEEVKNSKGKKVKSKIFPGYILIEIAFPEDRLKAKKVYSDIVLEPGVGTFVGGRKDGIPEPISQSEVEEILFRMGELKKTSHKSAVIIDFQVGEKVKVIDGPFKDLSGKIESIDPEKNKVRVKIEIFGMPTPVDLDTIQIEKI